MIEGVAELGHGHVHVQELGLGIYLTVKGFKASPVALAYARELRARAAPAAA
jgi:hypothetical protein